MNNKICTSDDSDRIDVITFGVGHGDCQLIEFTQKGVVSFRLLYDGGIKLSKELVSYLKEERRDNKFDLDIVVLSHVDADHRKGINELLRNNDISIGEVWLPCLPVFRRLSWLFPPRIQNAVELANEIEQLATIRNIPVIYPLQDHIHRAGNASAIQVCVISPARKLMKRLYSASLKNLLPLLTHTHLPLEWLINSSSNIDEDVDFQQDLNLFDNHALIPGQLLPDGHKMKSDKTVLNALEEYKTLQAEPDFFGQGIVNDTSLVLVIDATLEQQHRRRIVLTGDQENWVWIASEHPMGLGADVMKAPHHGGHLYLSDNGDGISDVEQFWLWTRPRIVTVSANGKHSLPHCQFREAVRMIGATLVCPNKRGKEWIFSNTLPQAKKSCAEHFGCETKEQHLMQKISLSSRSESLNTAACLSGNGHRSPAPIVVLQQKLIEPDESFIRWTHTEVRKHAEWLNKKLLERRTKQLEVLSFSDRLKNSFDSITLKDAVNLFNGHQRHALINDPSPVIRYAQTHNLLWTKKEHRIDEHVKFVAPLTEKEYRKTLRLVTQFTHLFFTAKHDIDESEYFTKNRYIFLNHVNTDALVKILSKQSAIPEDYFNDAVKSRIFHDLIRSYNFRVVKYDAYSKNFSKISMLLLHLYKNDHELPSSFIPAEWKYSSFPDDEIILDNVSMQLLWEGTEQEVLPPMRTRNHNSNNFCLHRHDLYKFYYEEYSNDGNEPALIYIFKRQDIDWIDL
ncbi:MBL fold metallo-hydrolase [Aeromonas enteropelogenes]|uniref:MBL fold metallo-hydrolase n=1 Tax=Aeromonas enteropelogenes TaxID=29489 RepID=UPI0022854BC3|nr:MBL fold metallo-hydrolase [Aeromonas enteropelogenes]MCZ0750064.1 MBL fold metallo-hydrolase [Aeromonas enteropelogenes]